ncbi:MAG TPA: T9SS type A sorting domain-containing protein, partial [Flavobacterium sp.]|nr:T9SS type A sorting domain-containing protein [Flavobacterium sp.]
YTLIVVDKDSFAVDTGRKRLRLKLLDSEGMIDPFPEYWIEGLGNLNHPLESLQWLMPDAWYTVLCNHYGDEMPYSVNEFMGEPFTCPEPTSEPEPWPDDYIPLINDNYWYVNSMMFTNMDSFWVQPIEEVTINETAYTHYQETIMVIDTPVVNDYYIREDVEAKRVYKLEDGNEYLMYDFSLEEGDNITLDFAGDLLEYTVVSKDSFAVNIGRQRVRLALQAVGSEATETWIEGLGNLRHPLKNFLTIIQDPHYTLLCNNYDGEVAYSVNEFMGAPFTCPERGTEPEPPLGINDYLNPGVSIYPNPFRESFVILTEVPLDKAVLTLHDILGREIKRMNISGSEIEVKREDLPAGIYMLRIEQDGRHILNNKLIAE